MAGLLHRLKERLHNRAAERARQHVVAARKKGLTAAQRGQTIAIARIIGNDLYPRHADGQALRNLDFILENEGDFAGCHKLFVLNRLFDRDAAQAAAARIRARGHDVIDLPFVGADYAAARTDLGFLGGNADTALTALGAMDQGRAGRARLWAIRAKLGYAMNINGARNVALAAAHARSDWAFVLDGSCLVTEAAFRNFTGDLRDAPFAPYLVLPMQRLTQNVGVDRVAFDLTGREEPQIALHRTAMLTFDARFPYGLRDKTSMFSALGVPGAWDHWAVDDFLPKAEPTPDRHFFKYATAPVFRLSSGAAGGQLERAGAQLTRYRTRNDAAFATIAMLDQLHSSPDADVTRRILGLN